MNAVLLVAHKQAVFAVIFFYLEPRAPFHCNRFLDGKQDASKENRTFGAERKANAPLEM